jgi:hypothetical protein
MQDRSSVQKHKALQVAILMSKCSVARISIINLIQSAYGDLDNLNIEILIHRLEQLAHKEHPRLFVDINYYTLCLKIEVQYVLYSM